MKTSLLFTALALPALLLAHPGHGDGDGFSIIHYFTEPMHAIISIGIIAAAYTGIRYFRRKKENT